jgi:hypothetical protein
MFEGDPKAVAAIEEARPHPWVRAFGGERSRAGHAISGTWPDFIKLAIRELFQRTPAAAGHNSATSAGPVTMLTTARCNFRAVPVGNLIRLASEAESRNVSIL